MTRRVDPTYPNVDAHTLEGVERAAQFIEQLAALWRGALRVVAPAGAAARLG